MRRNSSGAVVFGDRGRRFRPNETLQHAVGFIETCESLEAAEAWTRDPAGNFSGDVAMLRLGRTMAVHLGGVHMTTTARRRDQRLEVRTTVDERALINQAVATEGTDLTSFALRSLLDASRRVLADRTEFTLSADQAAAWDRINEAPARELPGLLKLMERTSPFVA
jgi:uncharacterized protein (DUF1778 family)